MNVCCMKIYGCKIQRSIINNLANQKCSRCHSWITSCHRVLAFFSPLMVCRAPYGHWRSRLSPLHCKNQSRGMNRCSSWPLDRVRVCVRECVRCMTLVSLTVLTQHTCWPDPIWSDLHLGSRVNATHRPCASKKKKKRKRRKCWCVKNIVSFVSSHLRHI